MRQAFTATLDAAIRHADEEARALHQEFVGTEHLLLGMLANQAGEGVRILQKTINLAELRRHLMKELPHGSEATVVTGRLPLSPRAQRVINTALSAAQAAGQPRVSTKYVL